jgi:hypothetical protein
MTGLERFDGQEDVSRREILEEAWRVTRTALEVPALMGDFFVLRNEALLDAGMGLGEYTYIYAVAYVDRLVAPGPAEGRFFDEEPVNDRVRAALRAMLVGQLAALRAAEEGGFDIGLLEAENAALGADSRRLPWQDGLPAAVAASIQPYRTRLDDLFCAASAPLELMRNRDRGIAIESE